MRKTRLSKQYFSFEKKEAAKTGLKPEEKSKKMIIQAAEEERIKLKKSEAQTNEATFGKEEEALEDKINE